MLDLHRQIGHDFGDDFSGPAYLPVLSRALAELAGRTPGPREEVCLPPLKPGTTRPASLRTIEFSASPARRTVRATDRARAYRAAERAGSGPRRFALFSPPAVTSPSLHRAMAASATRSGRTFLDSSDMHIALIEAIPARCRSGSHQNRGVTVTLAIPRLQVYPRIAQRIPRIRAVGRSTRLERFPATAATAPSAQRRREDRHVVARGKDGDQPNAFPGVQDAQGLRVSTTRQGVRV